MIDRLLVSVAPDQTRIALMDGARLAELHVDMPHDGLAPGDILLGTVEAAFNDEWFVRIGKGEPGLVGARHALARQPDGSLKRAHIEGPGQVLLVQVARTDPVKGPRLNVQVRLTGRYLELEPLQRGVVGLDDAPDELRPWLRHHRGPPGLAVRPAVARASIDDLEHDRAELVTRWDQLAAAARDARPPARLLRGPTALAAALRDHPLVEVICDDGATVAALRRAGASVTPHRAPEPLFADIDPQIEQALGSRVDLPGGGWISIEPTTALTAIDVNSGDDDPVHCNQAAAEAIAHQLRLRDIGGLVVIDFIRGTAVQRRRLMQALRRALADDPADVRVEDPTKLGLVELSRARQRAPLASHFREPCPVCAGDGAVETVAAAVADIRRQAARARPGATVQAAPAVAAALRLAAPDLAVAEAPQLGPRGWRLDAD
ncbi:MAG: ribonuclease E/G [Alphaproteobacteria bacterium]